MSTRCCEKWLIVAAHEDDEAKAAGLIFKERKEKEPLKSLNSGTFFAGEKRKRLR